MGPSSSDREEESLMQRGDTQGEGRMEMGGLEKRGHEPRNAWNQQQLEEAGRASPRALGGSIALQHAAFELLASRL